MQKVNLTFEQDSTDFREHQVSFHLVLENNGTLPIDLLALSPRIPEHTRLVETKDFSSFATKAQHTKLCESLSILTRETLVLTHESLRNRLVANYREMVREVLSGPGLARLYLSFFTRTVVRAMEQAQKREAALFPRIETSTDAKRIFTDIISKLPATDDSIKTAFQFTADKIAALEQTIGASNIEGAAIARIEPESSFRASYVVHFPRAWLNMTQYAVSVEASYRQDSQTERHNALATATIRISPKPFVLSLTAMSGAILGVVLKRALELAQQPASVPTPPVEWQNVIPWSETLAAVILALVFFNGFEFTKLVKEFRQVLGWRIAMLIGVLCGLGSDRIVAAIRALVGSSS